MTHPASSTAADRFRSVAPPAWVARLPAICGSAAALLCWLVLAGWLFGVRALTSVVSSLPAMKVNTALALLAAALGLILRTRDTPTARRTATVLAVVLMLLGVATAVEWVSNRSLGIDQLFLHDRISRFAGRPSPQSTTAMTLLGLVLLTWGRKSTQLRRLHQLAVGAYTVLVGSVLLGYLLGASTLMDAARRSAISPVTVVVMSVLAPGVLAGVADRRPLIWLWQTSSAASIVRRLLPVVVLAPFVLGGLSLIGQNAHWYDDRFGLALFAGSMILTLVVVTVATASELDASESRRGRVEGQLAAIFDNVPAPMSVRGVDGRFLQVNRPVAEALGVTPDVIVGKHPREFSTSGFDADTEDQDAEILARGTTVHADLQLPGEGGEPRDFQVVRFPVRDPHGVPFEIGSIALDVTERRQAEIEARDAAERFRALLDAAPDAAVIVDTDGTIQHINARTCEMFGYTSEELLGQSVDLLVPDSVRGQHAQVRDGYVGRPTPRAMGALRDLHARHKDGHEIPVEISLGPLPTEHGLLVSAAIRDVTAKRQVEIALRSAEKLFRSSFDDAPIGMLLTDLDTRIEQANEALLQIVGADRPAVTGQLLTSLVHPNDQARFVRTIEELVSDEVESANLDLFLQTPVYDSLECDIRASVLRDEDGVAKRLLLQVQDITERRRYEAQLQHMADHDPLTGLYNRRRFESELRLHVARCKSYGAEGALVSLDLDHFKQVNDTLGHNAGDQLIISIADVLRSHVTDGDILARLGGDEFAILMSRASQNEAKKFAEDIVRAIRTSAGLFEGHHRAVTVSAGISMFDSVREKDLSGEEMLIEADVALYDAKEAGRNTIAFYADPDDRTSRTRARLKWTDRIEHALDHHGFVLHAQPILDISDNTIKQYELLIRMLDEDGDTIPPGAFLYVAERVGLVTRIDEWVFNRAADLVEEHPDVRLEINLSAQSLGNVGLLSALTRRLGSAAINPEQIVFEVTETAAVSNITDAQNFAHTLRGFGCKLALDDFGAGFGSFYYLKHLPFDYVKIDGEFVQHALSNRMDQLIIASLVRIARGLDKRTIAEFVTNDKTLDLVRDLGVDYAQGYGVGRPVPLQEIFDSAVVVRSRQT